MVFTKKTKRSSSTRFFETHKQIALNIINSSKSTDLLHESLSSYSNDTNTSYLKRRSYELMKAKTKVLTPHKTSYRISEVRLLACSV